MEFRNLETMMAKGMTHNRRARNKRDAPGTVAIGARLRRLCARVAACRLGSVAIEFAVLLPVFFALIYGLFEFSRIAWTQSTLEYAVEEAARYAMINPEASETEISAVANDNATGLDVALIEFGVSFDTLGGGEFVTVDGSYTFVPIVKLVGLGEYNITSTVRMPIIN